VLVFVVLLLLFVLLISVYKIRGETVLANFSQYELIMGCGMQGEKLTIETAVLERLYLPKEMGR
jgi:hypothetical protein